MPVPIPAYKFGTGAPWNNSRTGRIGEIKVSIRRKGECTSGRGKSDKTGKTARTNKTGRDGKVDDGWVEISAGAARSAAPAV